MITFSFMFYVFSYLCVYSAYSNSIRVSLRIRDLPCFVFYERSRALPASKYAHARFVASLCTWLPITYIFVLRVLIVSDYEGWMHSRIIFVYYSLISI